MMYATTVEFLELFGLKDLENLPDLAEFRALEDEPAESPTDQELSGESMPVSEEAEAIAAANSEQVEEQPGRNPGTDGGIRRAEEVLRRSRLT